LPIIEIEGLKISYQETGAGLPIIFLPGLIGSKEWFKYQFSGLGGDYRVISYDPREAGRKPEYTIDLLVEDIAKLLTILRLHSVVIAGHSFGGLVAQQFTLAYPQSVAALILVSTFPRLLKTPQAKIAEIWAPLNMPTESPVRRIFSMFFGRKTADDELEGTDWLVAHAPKLSRTTINARMKLAADFDVSAQLEHIGIPALVVVGANEDPLLLDAAQTFYRTLPDATLEVIENGDHFSFFTRHDLFNSAVDDFLTSRMMVLG